MPASLVADFSSNPGGLEDQRALQLALELSMLGLNPEEENGYHQQQNGINSSPTFDLDEAARLKRGANMTECVPVPSSEHVAEIVGRQGCKIKALRAKTNTYIKTPVRGEEPVFVVTGRKEDVGAAKREIMSAAEHFSQIRASRRSQAAGGNPGSVAGVGGPPSPSTPGQVTIQVRVPYRVVGLVVGPKGATIKRIQQQTHTYIVTPSRDKEPVFEVTGTPENADQARREIESHIALRTGGGLMDQGPPGGGGGANLNQDADALNQLNDFHSNGVDAGVGLSNGELQAPHHGNHEFYGSMYNNKNLHHHSNGGMQQHHHPNNKGTSSAFSAYNSNNLTSSGSTSSALSNQRHHLSNQHHQHHASIFTFPPTAPNYLSNNHNSSSSTTSLGNHHQQQQHSSSTSSHSNNGFVSNGYGFYDNGSPLDVDDVSSLTSPVFGDVTASLSIGGNSVWSDVTSDITGHLGNNSSSTHHLQQQQQQQLPIFTTGTNLPMRSHSYACSTTPRLSPVLTDSTNTTQGSNLGHHHHHHHHCTTPPPHAGQLRRIGSDGIMPLSSSTQGSGSPTLSSNSSSSGSSSFGHAVSMVSLSADSASSSPTDSSVGSLSAALRGPLGPGVRPRACMVCGEGESVAAFVPCGHNLFCMDCAKGIMEGPELERRCPVCQMPPSQAIQIHHS